LSKSKIKAVTQRKQPQNHPTDKAVKPTEVSQIKPSPKDGNKRRPQSVAGNAHKTHIRHLTSAVNALLKILAGAADLVAFSAQAKPLLLLLGQFAWVFDLIWLHEPSWDLFPRTQEAAGDQL
jgi:hypothetical protein